MKPTDQQIAFGSFDDARSVIVPMFERKDEFGFAKRPFAGGGERRWQGKGSQQRSGEEMFGAMSFGRAGPS